MKVTILIDEYLPDTNQIVVRVCRMTSREPILNHKALAVDLDKLDLHDTESFLDSFMRNYGVNRVERQEEKTEIVLYANNGKKIEGELNLRDLVGENINYNFYIRDWDRLAYPHATKGFFNFKKKIPDLLKLNEIVDIDKGL